MSFTEIKSDAQGIYIQINSESGWIRHLYVWEDGNDSPGIVQAQVFPQHREKTPDYIDLPSAIAYGCDRLTISHGTETLRVQHRAGTSGSWGASGSFGNVLLGSIDITDFKLDYWKVGLDNNHSVRILIVIENHNGGGDIQS